MIFKWIRDKIDQVRETMAANDMSCREWDHLHDWDKLDRIRVAKKFGLDIYELRAQGWGCARPIAKLRLITWVRQLKPGTFLDITV